MIPGSNGLWALISIVGFFVFMAGCAYLIWAATAPTPTPERVAERARIRAGIIDWYSRDTEDVRRDTPRRRTGAGVPDPRSMSVPSSAAVRAQHPSAGPTAPRTKGLGKGLRNDGQAVPALRRHRPGGPST